MIPLLLRYGADASAAGPDSKTARDIALDNSAYDCVEALAQGPAPLSTTYPESTWLFAAWALAVPTLLMLLHVHVALLCAVLLVAIVRTRSSDLLARHMIGKNAFRSAVPFALL